MNKFERYIMKDIGWKLLSVAIAVALWFLVINIENPVETRVYTTNIEILNAQSLSENGLAIVNEEVIADQRISIRIRGQRMSLDKLTQNRSQIKAVADFSKVIDEGMESIPVEIVLSSQENESYEILSKNPSNVKADIQKLISKAVEVSVNVSGKPVNGMLLEAPKPSPQSVSIYGARNKVEAVKQVVGEVNIDGMSIDSSLNVPIKAVDADGNAVGGVSLSENEVTVAIGLNSIKRIQLIPEISDSPAEGYWIKDVLVEPEFIDVVGNKSALDSLSLISIPAVSVEGQAETFEREINIANLLPSGVAVPDGASLIVKVKVEIEAEIQKEIQMRIEQIVLEGSPIEGLEAKLSNGSLGFVISGSSDVIEAIDETKLEGRAVISNLEEGYHRMEVIVELPSGVSIIGNMPYVNVFVSPIAAEEEPPIEN